MPGLGVIVNVCAIIAGSALGLFAGRFIKRRMRKGIVQVQGLTTIVIGVAGSASALLRLSNTAGVVGQYSLIIFISSLIVGTLIGEVLAIETRLKYFGKALQKRLYPRNPDGPEGPDGDANKENRRFVQGFMTASLIYCVGAMTILGSIQDGLGNPDTLFMKSLLDGTMSIFLASTLGIGVAFSIVPVILFQGMLALIAAGVGDIIPPLAITGIEAVGGVLIVGVGLNLAAELKIRVGNMLPAVFVALALFWILA